MREFVFCFAVVATLMCLTCNGATEIQKTQSTWEVESEIYDNDILTAVVLRNTDPRDIVGAGGQLIVSGNGDTIALLMAEIGK